MDPYWLWFLGPDTMLFLHECPCRQDASNGKISMNKAFGIILCVLAAGCGNRGEAPQALSADDMAFQKKLQEQLLDAKPGTVIEIPAGKHALDRVLTLRANGVTIRGEGSQKSILSFKNEISGPEGMLVYASDFTIEHLAIEDSKGDGLKINDGENITIRDVRVEWTGGPKTTNGAYGIYPVKSKNVLIEDSASFGASDAGIYVGQSQNVIVRRNRAEKNVAGIEIENTIGADVYENTATGNTGGILVFNMPNLPQPGQATRVFKNRSIDNNLANFAAKGAAVASVPAGSGVVVNSKSESGNIRQRYRRQQDCKSDHFQLLFDQLLQHPGSRAELQPLSTSHFCLRQSFRGRRRFAGWPGSKDPQGGGFCSASTGISRTFSGMATWTLEESGQWSSARRRSNLRAKWRCRGAQRRRTQQV